MKKSTILALYMFITSSAFAEIPTTEIELGAIYINVPGTTFELEPTVAQYNHDVSIEAQSTVMHNYGTVRNTTVESTAVGNAASVDVRSNTDLDTIQGNQFTNISATSRVTGNRLVGKVQVDAMAIGNNLTVDGYDINTTNVQYNHNSDVSAYAGVTYNTLMTQDVKVEATAIGNNITIGNDWNTVHTLQENEHTSISAVAEIICNNIGDPVVTSTAVGNNLTIDGPMASIGSIQRNLDVDVSATSRFSHNRGRMGPVTVRSTAIGNSANITR